ncbi:MAG: hypothetical protein R2939_19335 [Kofleriaceae bacterium]
MLLAPLAPTPAALAPADRAELARLRGLAAYFAGHHQAAAAHWLDYLRLDLDGRLDPATVPPEAIAFFEDVRARHGAELRARRPRPRRWWLLNLVPPAGQLQNGERGRAALVGGSLALLLAAHVGSYALIRGWCDQGDRTCGTHTDAARTLRVVNWVSGVGAIATYVVGVVDGFRGARRRRALDVELAPTTGGAIATVGVGF